MPSDSEHEPSERCHRRLDGFDHVRTYVDLRAVSRAHLCRGLRCLRGDPLFLVRGTYRVVVHLKQQTVRAYGQDVPLLPGMQVQADVVGESRALWEWLLEPLYSVTGRMRTAD